MPETHTWPTAASKEFGRLTQLRAAIDGSTLPANTALPVKARGSQKATASGKVSVEKGTASAQH